MVSFHNRGSIEERRASGLPAPEAYEGVEEEEENVED